MSKGELITQEEQQLSTNIKKLETAISTCTTVEKALVLMTQLEATENLLKKLGTQHTRAKELQADAVRMRLLTGQKIGQLMPAIPQGERGGGRGKKKPASPDKGGFSTATLAKYRKLATELNGQLNTEFDHYAGETDSDPSVTGFHRWWKNQNPAKNTRRGAQDPWNPDDEWYTPSAYIESARKVMGSIDLDPCSSDEAQETVKATKYFTVDDDGLTQEWSGNIWMNPPYSKGLIKSFSEKLVQELPDQCVVLVNNATDTAWFQSLIELMTSVCFVRGRIQFVPGSGQRVSNPANGQIILFRKVNKDGSHSVRGLAKFTKEFSSHGACMPNPNLVSAASDQLPPDPVTLVRMASEQYTPEQLEQITEFFKALTQGVPA